jgi:hypothetical protein
MAQSSRSGDDEFIIVYRFKLRELGLKGVPLLLYARIYGFCRSGGSYYESRAAAAFALGTTSRSLTRAINELVDRGLISYTGDHTSPSGNVTRAYRLADPEATSGTRRGGAPAPDNMSPPDETSPPATMSSPNGLNPDGTSGYPVTGCHPIRKG